MSLQTENNPRPPPVRGMDLVDRFIARAKEAREVALITIDPDHRNAAYSVMLRYIEMAAEELEKITGKAALCMLAMEMPLMNVGGVAV